MLTYKYKEYDKIIDNNNQIGIITSLSTSRIDNKEFPSYWVLYDTSVHPDGYARNTWESSIVKKIKKQ